MGFMRRNCALPVLGIALTYVLSATPVPMSGNYSENVAQKVDHQQIDRRGKTFRQGQTVPYKSLTGNNVERRVVCRDDGKKSTVYFVYYTGDLVGIYNDTGRGLQSQGVMLKRDLRTVLNE